MSLALSMKSARPQAAAQSGHEDTVDTLAHTTRQIEALESYAEQLKQHLRLAAAALQRTSKSVLLAGNGPDRVRVTFADAHRDIPGHNGDALKQALGEDLAGLLTEVPTVKAKRDADLVALLHAMLDAGLDPQAYFDVGTSFRAVDDFNAAAESVVSSRPDLAGAVETVREAVASAPRVYVNPKR